MQNYDRFYYRVVRVSKNYDYIPHVWIFLTPTIVLILWQHF